HLHLGDFAQQIKPGSHSQESTIVRDDETFKQVMRILLGKQVGKILQARVLLNNKRCVLDEQRTRLGAIELTLIWPGQTIQHTAAMYQAQGCALAQDREHL